MDHVALSYDQLKEITNDFSMERKIGSGTYGRVYKGMHTDGETIAVKMLYDMPGLDDVQFKREFDNLKSLQHDNIVRLVGYCHESRQECVEYNGSMVVAHKIHRALCFEYAHKGSLHEHLFDEFSGHDWITRYGIIKGICNGLKYLHQELEPPMYHLDIKPANVLLDDNMLPKIADFGLSRLFGEEQTKITKSSIGTCGYLPPEYIEQHVISNKFDIFSLGVVIIKVMAGPKGYSRCGDMSSHEFIKLVHENWRGRLQGTSVYEAEPYFVQVKTCIEIALRCVEADRHKRPSISDIVDKLIETETMIRLWSPLQVDRDSIKLVEVSSIYDTYPAANFVQLDTCIEIALRCLWSNRHKMPCTPDVDDIVQVAVQRSSPTEEKVQQAWSRCIHGPMGLPGLRQFEYNELATATDRFSNLFVMDAFGTVYRGSYTNENGMHGMAVKKIEHTTAEDRDVLDDLILISETRHRNLVGLKGWCFTRKSWNLIDFMGWFRQQVHIFLVLELVPNGNLADYLYHSEEILPWEKRYRIIQGIGSALRYLHHGCKEPILHTGIMPSSVLLDSTFQAKLILSQLSRIACNRSAVDAGRYIDPMVLLNGFNRQTDVYSFGMVLLAIGCTGKNREHVRELYNIYPTEQVMEYASDPKLCGVFDRMEMERVIVLGLKCSCPDQLQRPSMEDVMKFLEDDIDLPDITEIAGYQSTIEIMDDICSLVN